MEDPSLGTAEGRLWQEQRSMGTAAVSHGKLRVGQGWIHRLWG